MKNLSIVVFLACMVFEGTLSFSQSFEFYTPDTAVYGDTLAGGDLVIDGDYILNKTSNNLTIDVVRVQDVDIANSGWSSAMCLDLCYFPTVDSVQYIIPPNDTVPFIPHFYITASPDSQTIYIKIKDANNPTDVLYQRFYGVTIEGYTGIHEYANLANVSVYPSPAVSGHALNMNITNAKIKNKEFTLVVYNIHGGIVSTIHGMKEGNNALNLNLASGMYSYNLVSGDVRINSGIFSISK